MALGRCRRLHNEPEEVMGTLREMAATMREQSATAHHMMERLEQRNEENSERHNKGAEVDLEYLKVVEFRKASPLSFRGAYNLDRADKWIRAIEKIFTVLVCTEEQRLAFATYMLEADAMLWWVGTKRLFEGAQAHMTWDVLKMHFYEKYFLDSVKNAKELEFMSLHQGTMNVAEYTAKFKELCKFSTIYNRGTRMRNGSVSSWKED